MFYDFFSFFLLNTNQIRFSLPFFYNTENRRLSKLVLSVTESKYVHRTRDTGHGYMESLMSNREKTRKINQTNLFDP